MLYPDLTDIPIEVFGGYCPAVPPSDLAPGAANVAQDVVFPQGAVRTRGGLGTNVFAGGLIPAKASINGLKSFLTSSLAQRLMAWDSLGNLYKESPQGTLGLVGARGNIGAGLLYQSQTLFGREYQAFFNSAGGFDIPRQFDDTNWDRVSQVGPGAAPNIADESVSLALLGGGAGASMTGSGTISAATEAGNICTITFSVSTDMDLLQQGDQIQVAGVGVAGYNGTFTVVSPLDANNRVTYFNPTAGLANSAGGAALSPIAIFNLAAAYYLPSLTKITVATVGVAGYNGSWTVRKHTTDSSATTANFYANIGAFGLAASGGGTATPVGNISAGKHQLSVCFVTRQGFITQAAPPSTWTSTGNLRGIVSKIPLGPQGSTGGLTIARLLIFTPVITAPAVTGSFYSMPNGSQQLGAASVMLIGDNTTTTATIDFTDTILIAGFQANYLFTQLELGAAACVLPYSSRLVWLGERSKVSNFVNMSFDGGLGSGNFPNGWTPDPAFSNGGQAEDSPAAHSDWAGDYFIGGDGATATRGKITQSAYRDYLGVAILQSNVSYSVRARVKKDAGMVQGTLHVNLKSVSGGFTTAGLAITAAQAGTAYAELTAVLTAPLSTIPSDILLQVYADGTPSFANSFYIDSIEVYPTNSPVNYSVARVSHAFNPESYDATTGQIQVRPGDGQQLRSGFPLRNNLYLAKDHYLCYVSDDGVNEPASWQVNEVSATIGICGPNAVDWTEEWAVFAERSGLYICWGSDPVKLTPEIQNDASGTNRISWASINWQYGHTIWVRIDKTNKMILVGAPVNGATSPNIIFMLDYRWLESAQDIASSPLITYSAFTGKMLAHGRGRRWAIWNITANSMCFAERNDGTSQPFFGNGTANGKIYQQQDVAINGADDGVAIPSIYQTYGTPSHMEEQQYQMGSHRKLFGYLKFRAVGSGLLSLAISTTARSTLLRSYTLSTSPAGDGERPCNVHAERFFINVSTNTVNTWFQLEKLIACVKRDASIPVRGVSS